MAVVPDKCAVCGEDLWLGLFHYKIEIKGKVENVHIGCLPLVPFKFPEKKTQG